MARLLSNWLESYLQYTNNSEPSPNFRRWVGISTVAAVMQRKCRLQWGTVDVYPNLYIVLVGPSGSRKGTAMGPAYDFLNDLGIKLSAEATTREALIRALQRSSNSSVDAITGQLRMHSSLTIFSQELTVFLGYNNVQLMTDLCDWYDCRKRWTYDTKNMGTDEILGVWVNLIGATTPDLLQSTLPRDAVGSGLTARMVLVYEPRKWKIVYVPHLSKEEIIIGKKLFTDLEHISMLSGEFKVTEKFMENWIDWRQRHESSSPAGLDNRFSGYIERRPMHMLKLTMILSASRGDSMIIDETDLSEAETILVATEKKMPRAFSGIGRAKMVDVLTKVWIHVATKKDKKTSMSDLLGEFHYDADKQDLLNILATLRTMKVVDIVYEGSDTFVRYIGTKDQEDKHGI
jgi:hypothetical protein